MESVVALHSSYGLNSLCMTVVSKFVDCSARNPTNSTNVKMTLDKTNGYVNEVTSDFKVSTTIGFSVTISGEVPGVLSGSAEFSLASTMEKGVPVTLLNQNSSCCSRRNDVQMLCCIDRNASYTNVA